MLKVILVIVTIILLPTISAGSIFNGNIEIDSKTAEEILMQSISKEEMESIKQSEKTMGDISEFMEKAGHDNNQIKQAQLIYMLLLSNHEDDPAFISNLSSCFTEGQTDEQLVRRINQTFNLSIKTKEYTQIMKSIKSVDINTDFCIPDEKNNIDLVNWAINAKNEGWGYVYGTYGNILTSSLLDIKAKQYPQYVGSNKKYIRENWLGGRCADCIGLIKGYCWYDAVSKEIKPDASYMPDIGANKTYENAKEKGPISTMPEIPGIALWHDGHIGVYIGQGKVIHAANTYKGVIESEVKYCSFTHWLKIPYINYIDEEDISEN